MAYSWTWHWLKSIIYLYTKLPCCTAQEEALCVRLDVNCCKSGCAMGNIPWVRVFSNHECAFPQTRKFSFFPLFRWKPFGYWQKVKCLGPISDTGLRECLTSDKGEGYREQEENCIWLSFFSSLGHHCRVTCHPDSSQNDKRSQEPFSWNILLLIVLCKLSHPLVREVRD